MSATPTTRSRPQSRAAGGPSFAGNAQQASSSSSGNPYAGQRQLRPKEQEVLGEYARLAGTIKRIDALSTSLAASDRHAAMLRDLRILERKMGLVLTLFKASVWSLIQTHEDEMEQQEQHGGNDQDQDEEDFDSPQNAQGVHQLSEDQFHDERAGYYDLRNAYPSRAYAHAGPTRLSAMPK